MLDDGGAYGRLRRLDDDGHWWIPSGRVFYSPDTRTTPPRRNWPTPAQHFFLPHRFRDPFEHSDAPSVDLRRLRPADAGDRDRWQPRHGG